MPHRYTQHYEDDDMWRPPADDARLDWGGDLWGDEAFFEVHARTSRFLVPPSALTVSPGGQHPHLPGACLRQSHDALQEAMYRAGRTLPSSCCMCRCPGHCRASLSHACCPQASEMVSCRGTKLRQLQLAACLGAAYLMWCPRPRTSARGSRSTWTRTSWPRRRSGTLTATASRRS